MFNYNIKYINKLHVAWRKAMRQLCNIDYRTHSYIIYSLSENIETRLYRKLSIFILIILNSENWYVHDVAHLLQFYFSTIAENCRVLSCMYNIIITVTKQGVFANIHMHPFYPNNILGAFFIILFPLHSFYSMLSYVIKLIICCLLTCTYEYKNDNFHYWH